MNHNIPPETLPPLVREFASYKSAIQNCSEKTVSEYTLDLRTFFRYLLARDKRISMDSEDFEKIDISVVDLDYIKNITTEDIYEFIMYADNVRGNMAAAMLLHGGGNDLMRSGTGKKKSLCPHLSAGPDNSA